MYVMEKCRCLAHSQIIYTVPGYIKHQTDEVILLKQPCLWKGFTYYLVLFTSQNREKDIKIQM